MEKTFDQLIAMQQREHPEVTLILEIATRAREMESKELPREIGSSAEVVAIPHHAQGAVN